MNILNNKKVLVLLLIGLLTVLFVTIFFGLIKKDSEPNDTAIVPVSGLVDPKDQLLNSVTTSDFSNIQNRFMEYLEIQGKEFSSEVTVVSVQTPYREQGPIKIIVNIPVLNEQNLEVQINYYAEPEPTFSIPSRDYITSLYGASTD